ncbi:unnamed protein product [Rotaria sp. Silwood1]|nr:unnamed protein product [Rotaria sp. Silwood1]CAF1661424.1 unnamed protein product [Rotaria sp. Silwood1]
MISIFIDVYPDLNGIISDKSQKSILSGIDFDETLAFAKCLKYFVDVAELLSEEKTATIQLVLPLKQRLIKLSKLDPNDPDSIIKLKKYIENEIPIYWELDDIHYMAAVLHKKMKYLQICPNKDKKKAYDLLKKEINRRQECFDQLSTSASVPDANDKLKRYLQANDSLRDDEDLFMFWKRQKAFYPTLYSIVCEILIIPATKTAAERLLSASGNTITNTRTRLSAEKVNKLMFIKKNLVILKKIFPQDVHLNHFDTHGSHDGCGRGWM